ncbi:MAG: hypothetical protein GY725_10840 [bacterium]|nr:hypothetical protein [bacterium]
MSDRIATAICAALLGGATFAIVLPTALARWWLSPDAIEHLLIAQHWIYGAGWVDPIQWYFYLDADPPLPAMAVRAPLVSIVAALPLWFGAKVSTIVWLQGLIAGITSAGTVICARRFMRLPAAIAAGALIGLSPGWLFLARFPWTEILAAGLFLAVVASAPGVARSLCGGLLCAFLTWLAWMARPNLSAMALAVIVAVVWQLGWRNSLRHRGLQFYVAGCAALFLGTHLVVRAATGLAPYQGYGVVAEMFHWDDLFHYKKEFIGSFEFVNQNFERIQAQIGLRIRQLSALLFNDVLYLRVGWLIPFGLINALRPRRDAIDLRVVAFALLGFSSVVVIMYGGFDGVRHALLSVIAAGLCGVAALDDAARWLEKRVSNTHLCHFLHLSPALLIAGVLAAGPLPTVLEQAGREWTKYQRDGTIEYYQPSFSRLAPALCPLMDSAARVASSDPWSVALWCGNHGMILPVDLDTSEWQERFIQEKRPRYLLSDRNRDRLAFRSSPLLILRAEVGSFGLWEVAEAQAETPDWHSPPPLACSGKPPSCAQYLGR